MGSVTTHTAFDIEDPVLIEGLPGVGLVGKIATDHIIDVFDMSCVGSVSCAAIPQVTVYTEDSHAATPPVRIYADESRGLLALQGDVPISRNNGTEFADCVTGWIDHHDVTPVYLSGLPSDDHELGDLPTVFGIGSGALPERIAALDIGTPPERGVIGGPTGALMTAATQRQLDAAALVVESDPQFPDPAGARRLIDHAIEPLVEVSVPTDDLVDRAADIRSQKEQLAEQMQHADEHESTQAKPLRMFQ
ncbi:proteasome assembly chaperone family protein [Halobacterium salinarum]|uniref:3-isopropylmalate dehydratase n=4 Tax=Halobacterium salinarum TaxID=2242 RepID=Q9HRX6_HALSA|nr:proteasome assembly chaperone family protein [Halobacterium salinarum]AAG19032.1 3-isopropylmalate dehydratase [Halobacterium salinarum NRC-1]MBB6089867.1 uncharacterized protein [Halobacterium salinarum]MDL0125915.1 proteasome assembly chaperone family protein [Halobacterium salinarum]MDL0129662.1 proteasome assembly chaperone family protein [Halobacterium salinarum]MDL0136998.1 proteasome assembly chaperone family protein [Halobacterium salinarum]